MDEIERAVRERLSGPAEQASLPPDLDTRIFRGVAVRRRRRRRAEIGAVATAATVILAVPTAVTLHHRSGPSAPQVAGASGDSPELDVPIANQVTIPRRLPGGRLLSALSLSANGAVLGQGASYDVDGTDHFDGQLWQSGPTGGTARQVTPVPDLWSTASDGGTLVWPEHKDAQHDFQLVCLQPGAKPRQLGDRGVMKSDDGFHIDNGIVVWTDEGKAAGDGVRAVWAAKGCSDRPRQVYKGGAAVAFSYPSVLILDQAGDAGLNEVNVETGRVTDQQVPTEAATSDDARFALNPAALAWSDAETLTVMDRSTLRAKQVRSGLPRSEGRNGERVSLTMGNDLLVYSARPMDGDPDTARSLVYNLRTEKVVALAGEAFTAGDWLLWRSGDVYRLGQVRSG